MWNVFTGFNKCPEKDALTTHKLKAHI